MTFNYDLEDYIHNQLIVNDIAIDDLMNVGNEPRRELQQENPLDGKYLFTYNYKIIIF